MADDDPWAAHVPTFIDGHYSSLRGQVRTHVVDTHLRDHLPAAPAPVVDVGGGAGVQSLPLARRGHVLTIVDASAAMLDRAATTLAREPTDVRDRVELVHSSGTAAVDLLGAARYAGVLCHGVIPYLADPAPLLAALCALARPGGVVSILAKNATTMAVRPAYEGRWHDALVAFDDDSEINALGMHTRGDTVEGLAVQLAGLGVGDISWYGVRLFAEAWAPDHRVAPGDLSDVLAVEVEASRRDPYRGLSRLFHLVGRRHT